MNVLILAQYFPPDIGGAATRTLNVAKGLALNGCKVTIVTAFPHYPHGKIPKEYKRRLIKVEWLGKIRVIRTFILPLESRGIAKRMFLFTSFAISSLFALPMVGRIDVIWAANPDILSIVPAIIYGKLKRSPITTNVDDLAIEDVYDLKMVKKGSVTSRIIEFLARVTYQRAKAITPISLGYVELISRTYSVPMNRIHVVRGGVDLAVFKPNRTQQEVTKTRFTVLYSGAFSAAYNFLQVLKAAKIIESEDKGVEFILQGKGELANVIKNNVKKLKLRNVKVIDRLLSRGKVAEFLNRADVLIQPIGDFGKPHLGISSKLYEYQAVAKPIICTSSGPAGRYVSETKSGISLTPGDYKALASAVIYLKTNPIAAQRMGRNGRRHVENNLSAKKIGAELLAIFKQVRADAYSKRLQT